MRWAKRSPEKRSWPVTDSLRDTTLTALTACFPAQLTSWLVNRTSTVLILDTAKGGVATAWMLHEMKARNMAPMAIVLNTVNTILAQGAAMAGMTMLAGFEVNVTEAVENESMVELDPETGSLRVLD